MQVDDLIRAARPVAPPSLERAVLARLDRPRRAPIVIGSLVAIAAIVCLVLLTRRDDQLTAAPDASLVAGPLDPPDAAIAAVDAAVAPNPPDAPDPADWEHLTALFDGIERDHQAAIAACGGSGAITVVVSRQRDGSARASHPLYGLGGRGPTPRETCRVAAVSKIVLPAMPAGLISVSFAIRLSPGPLVASHAWEAPLATLEREVRETRIAQCARGKLTITADRSPPHDPRVWLPRFQFPTEADRKTACAMGVFGKHAFPALPSFVGELQAHVVIP